jgi:capsule polysaccharide export protein KpsE/RkpR
MLSQNITILRKLYRKRKHILAVTVSAVVIAYAVCWFIRPVYKSSAFVYPANISVYSEESQTEQLLQFFHSSEVRQYLLQRFKLAQHWKIDTARRIWPFAFDEAYDKRVSITQTKYESIELRVEDFDPDTARELVHGLIEAVNWVIEKEHRQKYLESVKNAKIYLEYKKREVDSAQQVLSEMSEKYGLMNIKVQLKEAARNQYKLWTSGGKNAELTQLVDDMKKFGVEQGKQAVYFDDQLRAYAWAKNDYQKHLADYNHHTTFTSLASKPVRPVVAAWPKRTLVMLVTGFAALLFACIYFIFIDRLKLIYEQIASEK